MFSANWVNGAGTLAVAVLSSLAASACAERSESLGEKPSPPQMARFQEVEDCRERFADLDSAIDDAALDARSVRLARRSIIADCGAPGPGQLGDPRGGDQGSGTRFPGVLLSYQDARINESSGLAAAAGHPGVLYTHNDNGDSARFYAVGGDGLTAAVYTLPGADAVDWEDMAAGPLNTLWFGDIGDNDSNRGFISVYRVTEPRRLTSRPVAWTRYDFQYADVRAHNAETLLIRPTSGRLFIATKQTNEAVLYRADRRLSTGGYNTLNAIADIPSVITGGAFSHDGRSLVLRTYSKAYLYQGSTASSSSVADMISTIPTVLAMPTGGESVTFTRDDRYLLVGREGRNSPVWALPIED
jgi:hypothetical protein